MTSANGGDLHGEDRLDRLVISKLLNHAEGGVTKRYDRHRYDAEKRVALDRWATYLQGVVDGTGEKNVVPFAAARA